MNDTTLIASTTGVYTSGIALVDSASIASWIYIIVAIVSVLLGIITLTYNFYKAWKDDKKIDEEEKESLIQEIQELKKQLDDINSKKP